MSSNFCRSAASISILAVVTFCIVARGQDNEGDKGDWTWLRTEGTAALVLEPPPLKGLTGWVIESPRHRGAVICMAVAPDGTRAATGGTDGVVRIWNLETGTLEKALVGHRYHVHSMDWSPDGTLLATFAWGESSLIIWDVATGGLKKRFEKVQMRSLRWSRDGRRLASCTLGSGRINVVEGLSEPKLLTEVGQPVACIDWSPDATRLAVAAFGNMVTLIDTSSGKAVTSLELESDESFSSICFSPQGDSVATGNASAASIWDAATGTRRVVIKVPTADLAWSADGKQLATVSAAGVKFWDGSDGKPAGGLPATGSHIAWNHASGKIVVAAADRVQAWAADGKEPLVSIDAGGSEAPVFQAGKPVVTGLGTAVLSVWDPVTFKRTGRLEGHTKPVAVVAWSPDGKRFASGGDDGMIRTWDVKKAESLRECAGHQGRIACLAWSPDGKLLASAGYDKSVRLWSAEGDAQGTLEGHTAAVTALVWAPNGKQIVTGGRDKDLIIWDAVKMTDVRKIEGTVPITALAWSAVQGVPAIACGFQDGSIRVVNASSGEVLKALATGGAASWYKTSAVNWMPGTRPLLLASRYYLAQIWDVPEGKTVRRQIAPGGAVAVFPTAGGTLAVARTDDRTVRFWDPGSGTLRGVLLEEGDVLVALSTGGDMKHDPDVTPGLVAIVETESGQQTIPLAELAKTYGWKNNAKVMKLPVRN